MKLTGCRFMALYANILLLPLLFTHGKAIAQTSLGRENTHPWAMTNVDGRKKTSLNGKWEAIIDSYDAGKSRGYWKNEHATGKTDFYEYDFKGGIILNVPGDFNSQLPELKYYESTVWYKRSFNYTKTSNRVFVHFGAVNYIADVYLNGEKLGSHEGGFTPFQFEVTGKLKEGQNFLIVRVNNQRRADGLPSLDYDWWNYGGITRDVNLVETPATFVEDYFVHLAAGKNDRVEGWVKLNGEARKTVQISIPTLKFHLSLAVNNDGVARFSAKTHPELWNPEHPKLYNVSFTSGTDTVNDEIGFRNITVKGDEILLNGKSVFLRGVNSHEEAPLRAARAYSQQDALDMLTRAKELGCNFVRLPHYPQNEYVLHLADKMGIMLWEEIPIWQHIAFSNPDMKPKAETFMKEMVSRDKNRCSVIIWSLSNETGPTTTRTQFLVSLAAYTRSLDSTRLISSAINDATVKQNKIIIADSLIKALDVIGVNEYLGWYSDWPATPEKIVWESPYNKPVIMSEFGAEALYGNHGSKDTASSWSEEYQEQIYKYQIAMFKNIPFLRGTCPWVLADFKSPTRNLPRLQDGWNRKGLLSDKGYKKRAWDIMHAWYEELKKKDMNRN
jgi:beta-glucuronidase